MIHPNLVIILLLLISAGGAVLAGIQLLKSEDPNKKKAGRALVTSACVAIIGACAVAVAWFIA